MSTTETRRSAAHSRRGGTAVRAFIGSSTESVTAAEAIQRNLRTWCFPEIWSQGIFTLSSTGIESLERQLPQYAFAVFLLTPDDISLYRGQESPVPRDNLVLEVGLSIGGLTGGVFPTLPARSP